MVKLWYAREINFVQNNFELRTMNYRVYSAQDWQLPLFSIDFFLTQCECVWIEWPIKSSRETEWKPINVILFHSLLTHFISMVRCEKPKQDNFGIEWHLCRQQCLRIIFKIQCSWNDSDEFELIFNRFWIAMRHTHTHHASWSMV